MSNRCCTDILSSFWRSPLPVSRDLLQHFVHRQGSSQGGEQKFDPGAVEQAEALAPFSTYSLYRAVKYLLWVSAACSLGKAEDPSSLWGWSTKGPEQCLGSEPPHSLQPSARNNAQSRMQTLSSVLQKLFDKFLLNIISEQVMSSRRCLTVLQ